MDIRTKNYKVKNTIWKFILILVITFLILGIYSFSDQNLKIYGVEIVKTDIRKTLLGDTIVKLAKRFVVSDTSKQEETSQAMDSTAQRILLIGDSMLEGFMLRMKDYTEHNKHYLKPVIWYSSSTHWYGTCDTLSYFIKKYKPTYIILVIGANELFVRDIISKRTRYVKNILSQIGKRKYIWVGPPNWKKDTGINKMIVDNVGKKRYYPSLKLKYKRYRDGAHPRKESSAMWVDSVASWIMSKSMYPIILNKPTKKRKGTPNATLIQPKK